MIDPNIDFGCHQKRSRQDLDFSTICVQGMLLTLIIGLVCLAVAWVVD